MNELMSTVDWSRAQFALTAMYHWLFVPLTLGLAVIVAVMETLWYRTRRESLLGITKFWMTLFGINFAIGVATGIILEFEFGTNWSNYSWFVGDIFGAPLAIEGIFAFFMEATFVAVMFFGWNKVSPRFHLVSTWLVAVGVSLSALWILVANAWMQNPVGMRFDPAQMRNVMDDFCAVAFNAVSMNKFFHAVMSGWALAGAFVVAVSSYMLMRRSNVEAMRWSLRVGAWTGLIGLVFTIYTGDGSAVAIARVQPMKLAAMEGLYDGKCGQELVGFGILNTDKKPGDDRQAIFAEISIPKGLSVLANHDADSFVPGINDLINGISLTPEGDTVSTVSYAERIAIGKTGRQALAAYNDAMQRGDSAAMDSTAAVVEANFRYFGYGYLDNPADAVPPVALTFYAFRVMVMMGGLLLLIFAACIFAAGTRRQLWNKPLMHWVGLAALPVAYLCSEAGWVVAEVGRQPWIIQDLMPTNVAISDVSSATVQFTFWLFAVLFTVLLVAEVSIMTRYIRNSTKRDITK